MRRYLRDRYFHLIRKTLATDDAKRAVTCTLQGLLKSKPEIQLNSDSPYSDLDWKTHREDKQAVFITARFRSGSTFLWNVFRSLEGVTAYYEPFNERRWFDHRSRGDTVDESHKLVSEYWSEYAGLQGLSEYYDEGWIDKNLYMSPDHWNPNMKSFINLMIDKAEGLPILQFNRIDFRLPWIRQNFPGSRIIHLFRHPRSQWFSTLRTNTAKSRTCDLEEFADNDGFYLLSWARDLKYHFPFLDDVTLHPYEVSYLMWRLSYSFGCRFADLSIAYEDLIGSPRKSLSTLFASAGIKQTEKAYDAAEVLIKPTDAQKWKQYASADWFSAKEMKCEELLRSVSY